MNFIFHYLKGVAIGAGAILPGISSGVICVVFGIYDQLIDSILGFFHNIKSNFTFLFPIFLGIGTGIVLLGNVLSYLFDAYPVLSSFTFIGLILGSIPMLFKQVHQAHSFRASYLISLIVSFLMTLLLMIAENQLSYHVVSAGFLYYVLCGFLMSAGVVIPGVSSTAILMCLGVYSSYLGAVSSFYLPVLIPMGIGLLLGGFLFMKWIQYLFKTYFVQTHYAIIGFVLGSLFVIFPGFRLDFSHFLGVLFCLIGYQIANLFEK